MYPYNMYSTDLLRLYRSTCSLHTWCVMWICQPSQSQLKVEKWLLTLGSLHIVFLPYDTVQRDFGWIWPLHAVELCQGAWKLLEESCSPLSSVVSERSAPSLSPQSQSSQPDIEVSSSHTHHTHTFSDFCIIPLCLQTSTYKYVTYGILGFTKE